MSKIQVVNQNKEGELKMEQRITEIGTLEFSQSKYNRGYFTADKEIKLFSKQCKIGIRFNVFHYGPEGLTDEMLMAARACLETINNHAEMIEQWIKNYYDTEVRERAEEMGCNYVPIDDVCQLAQVVTPQELYIQPLKTNIIVGLYFTCDWDEERGVGIRFDTDGNIIKIGTGEIIY